MKVIITGATGMVGEGVLHESLANPLIDKILIINRKNAGIYHPKLKEIIHHDFYDLSPIADQLSGYDACLFCLGVSSLGLKEDVYYKLTHTLTLNVATTLCKLNPQMTFCYISGINTDRTEKGKIMWARVKGKTENDLMKLPFKSVYAFRPGFIKPIKGLKHIHSFYNYILWIFPIGRFFHPKGFCTLQELAAALISVSKNGYKYPVIEGTDIIAIAKNTLAD